MRLEYFEGVHEVALSQSDEYLQGIGTETEAIAEQVLVAVRSIETSKALRGLLQILILGKHAQQLHE